MFGEIEEKKKPENREKKGGEGGTAGKNTKGTAN